jgi:hypothetical protein
MRIRVEGLATHERRKIQAVEASVGSSDGGVRLGPAQELLRLLLLETN